MICVSLAAGYRANRVAGTPGLVQERRLRAQRSPRSAAAAGATPSGRLAPALSRRRAAAAGRWTPSSTVLPISVCCGA